jgi:hypothetical protein
MLDKLVDVPALHAEFTLIDGMGLRREGANEAAVQNLQTHATAATAVSTGGQNGFIVHARLLKIYSRSKTRSCGPGPVSMALPSKEQLGMLE